MTTKTRNTKSWKGIALSLKRWLEDQGYSVAMERDTAHVWTEDLPQAKLARQAFRAQTMKGKEPE